MCVCGCKAKAAADGWSGTQGRKREGGRQSVREAGRQGGREAGREDTHPSDSLDAFV